MRLVCRSLLLTVLIGPSLAGCAPSSPPTSPVIETTQDWVTALRDAGATVEETEILPLLPGFPSGQAFLVGGERVDVYEFASEAAREQGLASLLAESDAGGDLWSRGRLVVAYSGTDGPTIALLSGLLGDVVDLPGGPAGGPYPPAVAAAIGYLALQQGLDPGTVGVLRYQAVDWPDSCLGLGGADEICAAVMTPGWRVVLEAEGTTTTLRTDELGTTFRVEP